MKDLIDKSFEGEQLDLINLIKNKIENKEKQVIVTANTEIMTTNDDSLKYELLSNHTIIVLDGIGVKLSTHFLGYNDKLLYPGVDLIIDLLEYLNINSGRIAVLGSSKESLEKFSCKIKSDFPHIKIVGMKNGYSTKKEQDEFLRKMSTKEIDLFLFALGVPTQEEKIYENLELFHQGIYIGCGGAIDAIGGHVTRAPKIFRKTHTEWLYRLVSQPRRIPRFLKSNIKLIKQLVFLSGE